MINIHKSRFTERNYEKYVDHDTKTSMHNLPLKIQEMQELSDEWMDNPENFPEDMFHIFRQFLESMSLSKEHITFFDVGAAEGAWCCSVLEYFDSCDIVAFEPDWPRLGQFVKNIGIVIKKLNRNLNTTNIDLYECVVNDGTRETEYLRHYTCFATGGHAGSSRLYKAEMPGRLHQDLEYEAVALDQFVESHDSVDMIKIDVEGAELKVLTGSKKFIEKFKPLIFLEIHGATQNGSISISQVEDIFDTYNVDYDLKLIKSIPGVTRNRRHPFLEYYLCVPAIPKYSSIFLRPEKK